tara:strand:+ start:4857 stop:5273 length:417 start_codon:yes stop_codon:yes gene_type:complete
VAEVRVAVRTYLLTKTAITDIAGQRIYAQALPQGATIPAVTMNTISESYDHDLQGLAGIVQTRIQFECFASTDLVALSLADAIIWCGIDTLKGVSTGINFRSVMVEDGRRNYTDTDTNAGDDQRHVVNFDLMVTYLRG